jgi:WXXGXW repeat (2 copies)
MEVRAPEAPPLLPNEEQPPSSAEGYLWTPGSWSWGGAGYFWVPGEWVQPPRVGVLWTPGYWGLVGGFYVFHHGYWGPHVGYYGGINYGSGYDGVGYTGGRWVGSAFAYNRAVNNVNVSLIHNTYSEPVLNNTTVSKVSYHGGPGGTRAAPVNEAHPVTVIQRSAVPKAAPPIAQPNVVDTQSNTSEHPPKANGQTAAPKSTRASGTKPAQHPRP